ncbi:MAG: hypothetical protein HQ485_10095 [Acidobacteria bacterium]|nr:hypothetical protein [Acidobacteriota bacterium]
MRSLTVMTFAAIFSLGSIGVWSEVQSDFSGRWLLVDSQPKGTAALGLDVTIVQSGATIQMNRWTVGSSDSRTSDRAPEYDVQIIYELNGVEHPTRVRFEGTLPQVRSSPSVMSAATEESISKAAWVGQALVLMSYNKNRWTAGGRKPSSFTTRQTVRQVLSINSMGLLEVESLIVADPMPRARSVTAPSQVTSTYRRQE